MQQISQKRYLRELRRVVDERKKKKDEEIKAQQDVL
jgi:hypothetical protein